jgi:hypothetical protein
MAGRNNERIQIFAMCFDRILRIQPLSAANSASVRT